MKDLLDIFEDSINLQNAINVVRIDDDILQLDKGESPRFIDFMFKNEGRVGISGVIEYLPNKEGRLKIIERFIEILTFRVERITFKKGQMTYKFHFNLIYPNGEKELFGTHMTWLYPYWKKTTSNVQIEEPIITEQEAINLFEKINIRMKFLELKNS